MSGQTPAEEPKGQRATTAMQACTQPGAACSKFKASNTQQYSLHCMVAADCAWDVEVTQAKDIWPGRLLRSMTELMELNISTVAQA